MAQGGKTYTFYTHKGGVGKTTCLVHMAIKAVQESKHVLVIDCDPQLNSTSFFFQYCRYEEPQGLNNIDFDVYYHNLVEYHTKMQSNPINNLEQQTIREAYQHRHTNIWDILREVDPTKGIIQSFQSYEKTGIGVPIKTNGPGTLRLLGSHPMLNEMETYLAREINDQYNMRDYSLRFSTLVNFLIEKYALDLVFVDLSPSSSFLNQNIIMLSNYIILPCSADEFAYYSIRTIGMWLQSWAKRHARLNFIPKVLTVVYNKYKRQGENGEKVQVGDQVYYTSQAHAAYIRRLVHNEEGAMANLTKIEQFQPFILEYINYQDFPLLCDGLSTMSKLSYLRRTCYDQYINIGPNNDRRYHQSDRETCDKLRKEYDRLWNKIEQTFPEHPIRQRPKWVYDNPITLPAAYDDDDEMQA